MAMFSASVELAVKTTWSGRGQPKSAASLQREAVSAPSCVPRALLPKLPIARATASMTCGGLRSVVAALSR